MGSQELQRLSEHRYTGPKPVPHLLSRVTNGSSWPVRGLNYHVVVGTSVDESGSRGCALVLDDDGVVLGRLDGDRVRSERETSRFGLVGGRVQIEVLGRPVTLRRSRNRWWPTRHGRRLMINGLDRDLDIQYAGLARSELRDGENVRAQLRYPGLAVAADAQEAEVILATLVSMTHLYEEARHPAALLLDAI